MAKRRRTTARHANQFRIIGGRWRGRRLKFPDGVGIRPSPDRVRETLFNWLGPGIEGARCLDLFCGSGALGLEALSRGASEAMFVDADRNAIAAIDAHLDTLGMSGGCALSVDAFTYLAGAATPFDIVFMDPPYSDKRTGELCTLLEDRGWLAPAGSIYIETAAGDGEPALPPAWTLKRSRRAGRVGYHLAVRGAPE